MSEKKLKHFQLQNLPSRPFFKPKPFERRSLRDVDSKNLVAPPTPKQSLLYSKDDDYNNPEDFFSKDPDVSKDLGKGIIPDIPFQTGNHDNFLHYVNNLKVRNEEQKARIEDLEKQISDANDLLIAGQTQIENLKEKISSLDIQLQQQRSSEEVFRELIGGVTSRCDLYSTTLIDIDKKLDSLEKERFSLKSQLSDLEILNDSLNSEKIYHEEEVKKYKEFCATLENKLKSSEKEVENLNNEIQGLKEREEQLMNEKVEFLKENSELREKNQGLTTNLNEMRVMEEKFKDQSSLLDQLKVENNDLQQIIIHKENQIEIYVKQLEKQEDLIEKTYENSFTLLNHMLKNDTEFKSIADSNKCLFDVIEKNNSLSELRISTFSSDLNSKYDNISIHLKNEILDSIRRLQEFFDQEFQNGKQEVSSLFHIVDNSCQIISETSRKTFDHISEFTFQDYISSTKISFEKLEFALSEIKTLFSLPNMSLNPSLKTLEEIMIKIQNENSSFALSFQNYIEQRNQNDIQALNETIHEINKEKDSKIKILEDQMTEYLEKKNLESVNEFNEIHKLKEKIGDYETEIAKLKLDKDSEMTILKKELMHLVALHEALKNDHKVLQERELLNEEKRAQILKTELEKSNILLRNMEDEYQKLKSSSDKKIEELTKDSINVGKTKIFGKKVSPAMLEKKNNNKGMCDVDKNDIFIPTMSSDDDFVEDVINLVSNDLKNNETYQSSIAKSQVTKRKSFTYDKESDIEEINLQTPPKRSYKRGGRKSKR